MPIERQALLEFLRSHRYAVQSSVHATGTPQSAVVGIAVSDRFEIVFDTRSGSRKAQNLRNVPEIAFVIGSTGPEADRTVQFEGIADEPAGADRDRLVHLYLEVFPDGVERQQWPDLTYFRARPVWLRYSNYSVDPAEVEEFDGRWLQLQEP